jgi:hypothetical protein
MEVDATAVEGTAAGQAQATLTAQDLHRSRRGQRKLFLSPSLSPSPLHEDDVIPSSLPDASDASSLSRLPQDNGKNELDKLVQSLLSQEQQNVFRKVEVSLLSSGLALAS